MSGQDEGVETVNCCQCLDTGIASLGKDEGRDFCEACPVGREMGQQAELDEYAELTDRLSGLLRQTADALKGDPGPLTNHDWSDLPKVAADLRAQLAAAPKKTHDGTTCWACEVCGKTRTGRECVTCLRNELAAAQKELAERRAGPQGYGINYLRGLLGSLPDGEQAVERLNGIVGQLVDRRNKAESQLAAAKAEGERMRDDAMGLMYAAEKRAQTYMHERDALAGLLRESMEAIERLHGDGDFRNGNTDATGSIDEGAVMVTQFVGRILGRISAVLNGSGGGDGRVSTAGRDALAVEVGEEMVERACEAFWNDRTEGLPSCLRNWRELADADGLKRNVRAALSAALDGKGGVDGWASVEERSPEPRRYVLAWCPDRRMAFQSLFDCGVWEDLAGHRIYEKVTHWMEMPLMTPPATPTKDAR